VIEKLGIGDFEFAVILGTHFVCVVGLALVNLARFASKPSQLNNRTEGMPVVVGLVSTVAISVYMAFSVVFTKADGLLAAIATIAALALLVYSFVYVYLRSALSLYYKIFGEVEVARRIGWIQLLVSGLIYLHAAAIVFLLIFMIK
jgi:hypothetical protein